MNNDQFDKFDFLVDLFADTLMFGASEELQDRLQGCVSKQDYVAALRELSEAATQPE